MSESTTQKQVKVIRQSGPILGIVEHPTKTPWSVIEAGTGQPVRWEVVVYAPEACNESFPLIFESRDDAIAWVHANDCAQDEDWSFLRETKASEAQYSGGAETRSH